MLKKTQQSRGRGGHAPSHIRQAFLDAVDASTEEGWKPLEGLGWVLGQLWNCIDILPSRFCYVLDLPTGSTYAQAVRAIKPHLIELGIRL